MKINQILFVGINLIIINTIKVNAELTPKLLVADQLLVEDEFADEARTFKVKDAKKIDKVGVFIPKQNTQWTTKGGVLFGKPSTPENQASKKDHKGVHPRMVMTMPKDGFILKFAFKINSGIDPLASTKKKLTVSFFELGHHVARLQQSGKGLVLLADLDQLIVAQDESFTYEQNKWYQVMVERIGNEIFIQIDQGPVFYGKHDSLANPPDHHWMITGWQDGEMEVDHVKVWSVKPEKNKLWSEVQSKLPAPLAIAFGK